LGRRQIVTLIRLKFINEYRDRHGKVRRYFRRPGFKKTPLPGLPGSAEFMVAYQAALEGNLPKEPIGATRNAPGSVAAAVSGYLGSTTFAALAFETQRTRRNILERFRNEHGDKPIAPLDRAYIERALAARAKTPSAARNFLYTLRSFIAWCIVEGLRGDDPTAGVKALPIRTEGYATWPEEYVVAYRGHLPLGSKARLAFELYAGTGAARCDVARMGRQHVREGVLSFRRKKTGVLVEIPVLPKLQTAIDAMPSPGGDQQPNLTYLVTEYGKPFTDAGLGTWFRERCNMAGIPVGFSAHGVRKYAATEHANRGATAHELMAWFGWLTIREAERYTRAAARRKLALGMVQKLTT
jgi:integrase